ncbi:glutathione S-transferase-like [Malania oleifera]|uniref:glutathione S-transferase-like n=1 Tax=Malania oleifera TaxID=397392 RepID=UPI0025AE67AD|nr:glutathione S-transferase-like [Malania oleifera]
MGALKVHGPTFTTSTMRVVACLCEKGLQFELLPVDMRTYQHRSQPFLSLSPFGKLPAFEDGDLKLFESRAITKYIAHEYNEDGTQLVCDDPKKMAIIRVWMEVEAHHFDPAAGELTFELVVKPILGLAIDSVVVEKNESKLAKVLDVYEARLAQSKYLGGERFTLADLHHLPCIEFLMGTHVKELFKSRPHVNAWCADITARPSWSKALALRKRWTLEGRMKRLKEEMTRKGIVRQVKAEMKRDPREQNCPSVDEGCSIKEFIRLNPPTFERGLDSVATENWVQEIGEKMEILGCMDE